MGIFKEEDRQEIAKILKEKIKADVHVDLFIKKGSKIIIPGKDPSECPACEAIVEMFQELEEIDSRLTHTVHDMADNEKKAAEMGVDHVPAIVFNGKKEGQLIFYGIPSGYEFASLLETLGAVSAEDAPLFSPEMKEYLKGIASPVNFKVFVTPSCPYCPSAALSALMAAKLNKNIKAEVYEVTEFPAIGDKYKVEGVPKTVINETEEIVGGYPESNLKEKLEGLLS